MMFIAVDGIDGAGKTTLVQQLVVMLKAFGPLPTKEPTDQSHWGQKLRAAARNGRLTREKEIEYFHRDRLHHIQMVIRPALEAGKTVISDRYVDSTLAFQADSPAEAKELYERFLPDIIVPDVTFILDCPVDIGLARIKRDRPSVTEYERHEVLERARAIYRSRKNGHYKHLDASGSASATFKQARDYLVATFRQINAAWAPPSLEHTLDA
jgi:dTMP kinase